MITGDYHNDADRLFYNTGNRQNTNRRCGLSDCKLKEELYSNQSLYKRFKYFKCKRPNPCFNSLQNPDFLEREKVSRNEIKQNWMFNPEGKILELQSGMILCKNMLSQELLDKLGESTLFDYTTLPDARNNVTNINRDFQTKLNHWLDSGHNTNLKNHEMKELRWATLGRHHNWLETTPGEESGAGKIPELLQDLGDSISKLLQFQNPFFTRASIINFYPANNSTIGIHRDDADYQVAPIITVSLGCPAVFQIGVGERDENSQETFLENGDICVLDGRDRSAFHAVPRILDFQTANEHGLNCTYHYSNIALNKYLQQARINISLRQID